MARRDHVLFLGEGGFAAVVAVALAVSPAAAQSRLPQELMLRIAQKGIDVCRDAETSSSVDDLRRRLQSLDADASRTGVAYRQAEAAEQNARSRLENLRRGTPNWKGQRAQLEAELARARAQLSPVRANIEESLKENATIAARLAQLDGVIADRRSRMAGLGIIDSRIVGGLGSGVEQRSVDSIRKVLEAELRAAEKEKADLIAARARLAPEIGKLIDASPGYRAAERQEQAALQALTRMDQDKAAADTALARAERALTSARADLDYRMEYSSIESRYYIDPVRACVEKRIRDLASGAVAAGGAPPGPTGAPATTRVVAQADGQWRVLCPKPGEPSMSWGKRFLLDLHSDGTITAQFGYTDVSGEFHFVTGRRAADGSVTGSGAEPANGMTLAWRGVLSATASGSGTVTMEIRNPTYSGTCLGRWWTKDQPAPQL